MTLKRAFALVLVLALVVAVSQIALADSAKGKIKEMNLGESSFAITTEEGQELKFNASSDASEALENLSPGAEVTVTYSGDMATSIELAE